MKKNQNIMVKIEGKHYKYRIRNVRDGTLYISPFGKTQPLTIIVAHQGRWKVYNPNTQSVMEEYEITPL